MIKNRAVGRFSLLFGIAFALTLALWASPLDARQPMAPLLSPSEAAAVDAAVQAEMQKDRVVGMAIGIIQNGRIAYLKGYGLADREKNVPVTTTTMFRWASCTKSMAAMAAMQLVEKGQLDLDKNVREYVPEFPLKLAPKFPNVPVTITSRYLLEHQSGIPHYHNGRVIGTTTWVPQGLHPFADPVVALNKFKASPLLFKPGEQYSYSSYGYLLLSAVVQRAGHQKFADQISERISRPLGLTTLQPDYQWIKIDNRAVGYRHPTFLFGLDSPLIVPSTDTDQSWKWGAGGYISSVTDFTGFVLGVLNTKLVSKTTETQMWTLRQPRTGGTRYGLGFDVTMKNGMVEKVAHSGDQEKTKTRFVIYPGQRSAVVVMTNSEWVEPGKFTTLIYSALSTGTAPVNN
jgi:CubicO group peptidase (beta-lactamase class C family)